MIRRGNSDDVQLLQTIGRKTFDDTFGGTCTKQDMKEVLDLFFNTAQCEAELRDEDDYFYFLEEDGMEKGYMRLNQKNELPIENLRNFKCLEVVRLYVLKEFHGTGVADRLMNFAVDYALNKGYGCMYLSVWEYNFRARGFYEKHGFVNTGIEHDFPLSSTPQTDLWFVKMLN